MIDVHGVGAVRARRDVFHLALDRIRTERNRTAELSRFAERFGRIDALTDCIRADRHLIVSGCLCASTDRHGPRASRLRVRFRIEHDAVRRRAADRDCLLARCLSRMTERERACSRGICNVTERHREIAGSGRLATDCERRIARCERDGADCRCRVVQALRALTNCDCAAVDVIARTLIVADCTSAIADCNPGPVCRCTGRCEIRTAAQNIAVVVGRNLRFPVIRILAIVEIDAICVCPRLDTAVPRRDRIARTCVRDPRDARTREHRCDEHRNLLLLHSAFPLFKLCCIEQK
ncbi:hypothetical protein G3N57_10780 [Paraburkholderia sp. Se-20369]|nr:hypothetical protein [Paraburkholderia sp. Se-20369]